MFRVFELYVIILTSFQSLAMFQNDCANLGKQNSRSQKKQIGKVCTASGPANFLAVLDYYGFLCRVMA